MTKSCKYFHYHFVACYCYFLLLVTVVVVVIELLLLLVPVTTRPAEKKLNLSRCCCCAHWAVKVTHLADQPDSSLAGRSTCHPPPASPSPSLYLPTSSLLCFPSSSGYRCKLACCKLNWLTFFLQRRLSSFSAHILFTCRSFCLLASSAACHISWWAAAAEGGGRGAWQLKDASACNFLNRSLCAHPAQMPRSLSLSHSPLT